MGIYINKNGTAERYDGAPSAAGQSYNNASSGLSATNTQAAIDEVNSKVEEDYTLIATTSGTSKVQMNTTGYKELVLWVHLVVDSNLTLYFTESVPVLAISTSGNTLRGGGAYSTELGSYQIAIWKTEIRLDGAWNGGTLCSDSFVEVYAK